MKWSRPCDQLAQLACERLCIGAFGQKNHARLGAKLACAESEGSVQASGNFLGPFPQRAGQDEDWVRAAHLRIERNRLGAYAATSIRILPAARDPVKPPARTSGCF